VKNACNRIHKLVFKLTIDLSFKMVFKLFFLLLALTQINATDDLDIRLMDRYKEFMKEFDKKYASDEEMNNRFEVFKKNFLAAKVVDEDYKNKEYAESLSYGTTQFMDLTPEEFEERYLSLKISDLPTDAEKYFKDDAQAESEFLSNRNLQTTQEVPDNWDWREHGAISPIKHQGTCGSCWAFTSISNIESQYFLKYGKLMTFSEQQMVDCDYSNSGCLGGIPHNAFNYAMKYGLIPSLNYPYIGFRSYCRYNSNYAVARVTGYRSAGTYDEEKIKEMLYKVGPLAITINARTLQYYRGGILDIPYQYCPYAPNHGVNIVGYGVTTLGQKYWIIRNTWGTTWGEQGYFRIARGKGLCGINQYVFSATVE
jgi:cathepsin F